MFLKTIILVFPIGYHFLEFSVLVMAEYYNSVDQFRENGSSGVFGGEVVPVRSNVENGEGVLISVNTQGLYVY